MQSAKLAPTNSWERGCLFLHQPLNKVVSAEQEKYFSPTLCRSIRCVLKTRLEYGISTLALMLANIELKGKDWFLLQLGANDWLAATCLFSTIAKWNTLESALGLNLFSHETCFPTTHQHYCTGRTILCHSQVSKRLLSRFQPFTTFLSILWL